MAKMSITQTVFGGYGITTEQAFGLTGPSPVRFPSTLSLTVPFYLEGELPGPGTIKGRALHITGR